MKYYKVDDGRLIQFNPETNIYKIRNNIEKIDTRLSVEEFNLLDTKQIKRNEFSRLMNIYFKDIKHEWEYDGKKFCKLSNFESKEFNQDFNFYKDVPRHNLKEWSWLKNLVLVYHWGKIYYHTISYNGEGVGQLINPKTMELVRWCKLKHCAPVYNLQTYKIC